MFAEDVQQQMHTKFQREILRKRDGLEELDVGVE